MSALSEACESKPFSNGTEGQAWMSVWCEHCTHDHDISHPGATLDEPGCDLILHAMMPDFPCDDFPWPEAWLPEPTGSFSWPSRMICGQFQPCEQGDCTGDPHAEVRAAVVAEVTDYWRGVADG
jgi:hypothetical protein